MDKSSGTDHQHHRVVLFRFLLQYLQVSFRLFLSVLALFQTEISEQSHWNLLIDDVYIAFCWSFKRLDQIMLETVLIVCLEQIRVHQVGRRNQSCIRTTRCLFLQPRVGQFMRRRGYFSFQPCAILGRRRLLFQDRQAHSQLLNALILDILKLGGVFDERRVFDFSDLLNLIIKICHPFPHYGVPMVFNAVVCSPRKIFGQFGPFVALSSVEKVQNPFLIFSPSVFSDVWIEMVVPAFPALFPQTIWDVFGDSCPVLSPVFMNKLSNPFIFLESPRFLDCLGP